MELIFIILLVGLTSVSAYYGTRKIRGVGARPLHEAFRAFFEWIGTFTLFLAANLAVGVMVIFLVRGFTPRFVALYAVENLLLLILSAAQAFVFQYWWRPGASHSRTS
jgi:hypothetical protein